MVGTKTVILDFRGMKAKEKLTRTKIKITDFTRIKNVFNPIYYSIAIK